jgi:hypothetical protein
MKRNGYKMLTFRIDKDPNFYILFYFFILNAKKNGGLCK